MIRPLLPAWALFSASIAFSAEPLSRWTVTCGLGKKSFTLVASSKSGDPFEDDMTLRIFRGAKAAGKGAVVPVGNALFMPISTPLKDNPCKGSAGLEIPKEKILVLLGRDDRPSANQLIGVLVDTASLDILDVRKDIGSYFEGSGEKDLALERTEKGVRARLWQGWAKNGKTDSVQEVLAGWMTVKVEYGNNIRAAWEKPLPDTHGPYGRANADPAR